MAWRDRVRKAVPILTRTKEIVDADASETESIAGHTGSTRQKFREDLNPRKMRKCRGGSSEIYGLWM